MSFLCSYKSLIINVLQDIVRVSFSAPNASQSCGAFLFVCRLVCPLTIVHVSLVQENFGRTALPCTSLADLTDHPPDSGRLEQKPPARYAFWCTSETCTSRHHLEASKRTSTNKLQFIGLFHHRQKKKSPLFSATKRYPQTFPTRFADYQCVVIA